MASPSGPLNPSSSFSDGFQLEFRRQMAAQRVVYIGQKVAYRVAKRGKCSLIRLHFFETCTLGAAFSDVFGC
jgi:hypothetical protein